jgi:hypothetical protein
VPPPAADPAGSEKRPSYRAVERRESRASGGERQLGRRTGWEGAGTASGRLAELRARRRSYQRGRAYQGRRYERRSGTIGYVATSSPQPDAPTGGVTTATATAAPSPPKPEPVSPVRRLLSFAIAGFAFLLGVGLIFGAQTAGVGSARIPYAIVVFGIQVLYVLALTMALRPPGIRVVAVVGILTAAAADVATILPDEATVAPLGYLAAAGFGAGVVGQLVRREGRIRVTESLGATLIIVVGVIAYATLVVLTRLPIGTQAITVCLTATGVALMVARLVDTVAPWPRLAPQVPRGSLGVVLGAMLGTAAAAYLGSYIRGFDPGNAALVGLVTAVAAVLADLSVGYAEAGRRLAGEPPTMWVARHLQGPLAGFAVAAPLAYLISALFFVPRYF